MTTTSTMAKPNRASTPSNAAALAGRLLLAVIFLASGAGKIAAPAMTIGYIQSVGLPFAEVGYFLAILVEVIGGLALIIGFHTRWAALALAIFTIVAAVLFHNNLADQNQMIHFMKNLAITGGLLQVIAFGAGRVSIDERGRA
ncbi:DoxX family protein [Brevundimonas intermedia]|uniref:DoxX family protein n=1 Tax=Brevundimonas intermedia TaxID=74315 RepID=A0A4Y9S2M8_9CAUL|nr:DoxX family protein [Brevundimonas intermedia]TFW14185.1 DoxX family protein [Brevundimonas intermedia]